MRSITCRNRHCSKCQGAVARRWLEARKADLLPVEYYHLVFTLPAPISAIAYYNKAVIYAILFRTAAETLQTIAADPRHLGARIGVTLVLHTWGSAMTHHPHVHGIVPGGGLSPDGQRWVSYRPGFFLPVRVLFRLFRHYGLIANAGRRNNLAQTLELLMDTTAVKHDAVVPISEGSRDVVDCGVEIKATYVCLDCGAPMTIIDTFIRGQLPRAPPGLNGGSP